MKEVKSLIGFYNPSVILTYIGLGAASVGMFLSIEGKPVPAAFCLLAAGICDAFDGKIARMIKRTDDEKKFGIQIDSLCDMVCFGAFPAVFAWNLGVRGVPGAIILALYVLAGVIRLGYFNVTEESRQEKTNAPRHSYQGLPITTSSIVLPILYAVLSYFPAAMAVGIGIAMLLMAAAFILNIRIPKLSGAPLYIALGGGIIAACVLLCLGV